MKKVLVVIILAAVLGAGKTYWSRGRAPAVVLSTEPVRRGDLVVSISATGTVEPEEVIDVGAEVAGEILSFGKDANGKTVDYCSPIEAGTVLARIDDALYRSEVTQAKAQVLAAKGGLQHAEADLEQIKAKLFQAQRDWERAQQLGPSKALSGSNYDTYKSAYDVAKADIAVGEAAIVQARGNLAQAEGMLERAERNLGYTTITSPVKGVIIDRRVNIGQTVVASLNAPSLFLIAKDLTRMQVWVAVNEADIGRLAYRPTRSLHSGRLPRRDLQRTGGQDPLQRLDDPERRHVYRGGRDRQLQRATAALSHCERQVRAETS